MRTLTGNISALLLAVLVAGLLFRPHHFNVQKASDEIPLADVVRVTPIGHGNFVKSRNGVLVELRSGVTYRFVVNDRERVVAMIRRAVERKKAEPVASPNAGFTDALPASVS